MPTPIEPDTKVNSEWVASANIQTSEKAISETQEPAPAPASNETGPKIGAVWRGLVGIETGIVAGAVMTVYLMLDAALRGSSVWSLANLCASNFYGASALGGSFRGTTMAGLAWRGASSGVQGWITSLAL
ncbi:MAG: hypothetical protein HY236_14735, partial [Acidobacteria bacterium]|nr:hypothetical protein [Acidobacteriota bacterium]